MDQKTLGTDTSEILPPWSMLQPCHTATEGFKRAWSCNPQVNSLLSLPLCRWYQVREGREAGLGESSCRLAATLNYSSIPQPQEPNSEHLLDLEDHYLMALPAKHHDLQWGAAYLLASIFPKSSLSIYIKFGRNHLIRNILWKMHFKIISSLYIAFVKKWF